MKSIQFGAYFYDFQAVDFVKKDFDFQEKIKLLNGETIDSVDMIGPTTYYNGKCMSGRLGSKNVELRIDETPKYGFLSRAFSSAPYAKTGETIYQDFVRREYTNSHGDVMDVMILKTPKKEAAAAE